MIYRFRAFLNNKETVVTSDTIINRKKLGRETFDIDQALRDAPTVTLEQHPVAKSENVFISGIYMTEGSTYDYTISGDQITFRFPQMLRVGGHITITYQYLD